MPFDRLIGMPGAFSVLFILTIILPLLNLLPQAIILPVLLIFSLPVFYVFMISVVFNKEFKPRKNVIATTIISYLLYILISYPFTGAFQFYAYSSIFLFSIIFGLITYLVYYIFLVIARRIREPIGYRKRFLFAFLPSLVLMLGLSFFINLIFGEFLLEIEGLL